VVTLTLPGDSRIRGGFGDTGFLCRYVVRGGSGKRIVTVQRLLELYRLSIKIDAKDAVDLLGETKRDGLKKVRYYYSSRP
jgi:hypothetical protein